MKLVVLATLAVALILTPLPASATQPGAIFSCQFTGQTANVDPIVSPGAPSEHPHIFYGARDVQTIETSADLRTHASTCVETNNHSAYWMPQPTLNGVPLKAGTTATGGGKHFLTYYRCVFSAAKCAALASFPDDFKLVVGNSHAAAPAENPLLGSRIIFKCGTGSSVNLAAPPADCAAEKVLTISFRFGPCVDLTTGANIDPVSGGCPAGYTAFPRVEQFFRFYVGTAPIGDALMLGEHPWYSAHSDYFFAWDRAAFENFMNQCIRANVACPTNVNV